MPKSINKVNYAGHLGGDPEVRETNGGQKVANLRIAASRSFKKKGDEEWTEETTWMRVTVWGRDAERCEERLHKGDYVQVFGRLQVRDYEDKDGNKRQSTDIVADEVIFQGKAGDRPPKEAADMNDSAADAHDDMIPY